MNNEDLNILSNGTNDIKIPPKNDDLTSVSECIFISKPKEIKGVLKKFD